MKHVVRHHAFRLIAAGMLCILGCDTGIESPPADYTVVRCSPPPAIDGILNEDCWKMAETIELNAEHDADTMLSPTSVRLVRDETHLYLGVECQDSDIVSSPIERDGPVNSGDYVICTLDVDGNHTTAYMFECNALGNFRDSFMLIASRTVQLDRWDCPGVRISSSLYGEGPQAGTSDRFWTLELAIPFAGLDTAPAVPPPEGSDWFVSFARYDAREDGRVFSSSPGVGRQQYPDRTAFLRMRF